MFSTEDVNSSLLQGSVYNKFHPLRAEHITNQIQLGRNLKNDFLYPFQKVDDDLIVPLMTKQISPRKKIIHEKSISIMYFTDPICSTCWIIQPQLRKLQLEYNEHVNIEYKMSGLLPSWENYNRFGITTPSDVAAHWEEVCSYYEMPINKNIWLEDPLPSSYPPSIAFKAAEYKIPLRPFFFLGE